MAGIPDLKTNLEITLTFWGLFKKFSLHSMLVEVQKKKNGRGEVKYIYLSLAVFYWGLVEGDIIPLSSFCWVAQISKSPQKTILHCAAVSSQEIWATQHSQASYWQEDDVTQYTTGVGETQVYIVYFCHLFFLPFLLTEKEGGSTEQCNVHFNKIYFKTCPSISNLHSMQNVVFCAVQLGTIVYKSY